MEKTAEKTVSIYLASPLGFSAEGRLYIKEILRPELEKLENVSLTDPWAEVLAQSDEQLIGAALLLRSEEAVKICLNNFDRIDKADIVLANLNGADPDSGTCVEIGYAFAKGKMVIGYRTDFRLSGDCVGLHVNMQVEAAITRSEGEVFDTLDQALHFIKEITHTKRLEVSRLH